MAILVSALLCNPWSFAPGLSLGGSLNLMTSVSWLWKKASCVPQHEQVFSSPEEAQAVSACCLYTSIREGFDLSTGIYPLNHVQSLDGVKYQNQECKIQLRFHFMYMCSSVFSSSHATKIMNAHKELVAFNMVCFTSPQKVKSMI